MPKNPSRRRGPNRPLSKGPTQEERRRKAAARPLGGGSTPRTQSNSKQDYGYQGRNRFIGLQRATAIIAIIMLIALVLSLVPSCLSANAVAASIVPYQSQNVAIGHESLGSVRYLQREAAEYPPTASLPRPTAPLPENKVYIGETGHYISGPFLNFWRSQGGTAVFGNPLSEEFVQNGWTVQLFEKALLESHPSETDVKNQVQLGFLGRQLADARGLHFVPATNTSNSNNRVYFNETGQAIAGPFKTFWEKNNGVNLLGLPVSGEQKEGNLTVQYFERGVLQKEDNKTEPTLGQAGQDLMALKGWPRPTRLNMELDIDDTEIYQGRTLSVRLEPDFKWEPQDLRGSVGDEVLRMGRVGPAFWSFKAFAPWAETKPYPLQIFYTDPAGRNRELTKPIKVVKFDFGTQNLYLPSEKDFLTDKANDDYDNAQLAGAYNTFTPQMLWKGAWSWPTVGEFTTEFGQRRTYGDGTDYEIYHGGLDIAQSLGTPVTAPADGKIIFTGQLKARGNAIAIDHGLGVTSYYFHLNSILVKPGDKIKKGQIIGQVGTTGRSNGPHLHWEVRVNGVITYPRLFVNKDLSY